MKRTLTLLLLLAAGFYAGAQGNTTPDVLQLKESEYNFSEIPQGKPVYHTFVIVNNGNEPLKLDNVAATCGCTTPEWSRDPIAPHTTANIKVGYNAMAEGHFEKFITITYNNTLTKQLKITGSVWKAPKEPHRPMPLFNF